MLQDIRELNDEDLLVEGVMCGLVAYDLETRAELTRGTGRRKLGRPQRYTVNAPNGEKMTRSFRDGDREVDRMRFVFHLTAFTDSEALEKAQKMFSKKYETFRDIWGIGSGTPPQSIGE